MSLEKAPISYDEHGEDVVGLGAYRVLETFTDAAADTDEAIVEDVRRKMRRALQDYPALAHKTVTIGRLDPDEDVLGRARFWNLLVLYPTDRYTSFQTVYHELAHLAIHIRDQRGEDVPPTSEEFCSIFAIARMPPEFLDEDRIAYLGHPSAPQKEWPEICERALEYRDENGVNSHYIQRAREWLGVDE
ncbi:hypothetical protein [Haloarcula montana]|uniref:hypothetical protein n=1 Tax=Haloarcula montana TaxID=3111776 RepID=UPI002D784E1B|nr:hypothetical protein [Haloarcula sp. GH36]